MPKIWAIAGADLGGQPSERLSAEGPADCGGAAGDLQALEDVFQVLANRGVGYRKPAGELAT
ncbi:hypothetical protein Vau01_108210 [Virgisporangium aurantiacum]|uniref:Uncharacterized protein n=1 Tax=Virgisporangium aurantiacum TaxID=175570 RepID=A0A8J3ZKV6_9ACTN|nr:hypothetical protein [Virgisporangium aurantiacum]GIJ63305.1 hypothetical protein Vau01_108210 [Virgisporangium aurantiacum]